MGPSSRHYQGLCLRLLAALLTAAVAWAPAGANADDGDVVFPYPNPWNGCYAWFGGIQTSQGNPSIFAFTSRDADVPTQLRCSDTWMFVGVNFRGSDSNWHWYPDPWVSAFGMNQNGMTLEYWTDYAIGYHQLGNSSLSSFSGTYNSIAIN